MPKKSGVALTERFTEALTLATRLHAPQLRKGTKIPYIGHLLAVTSIAIDHGANEDEAIAALLHDAIEDAPADLGPDWVRKAINHRFGPNVLRIVEGCTDTDARPKPPWRGRKKAYLRHVAKASRPIALVSAADKLHNARAILHDYRLLGEKVWERFAGRRDGTLWYYRALVKAFHGRAPTPLVAALDRVVSKIEKRADRAAKKSR